MNRSLHRLMLAICAALGIVSPGQGQQTDANKAFWEWFAQNQQDYFHLDPANSSVRDKLFSALSAQLERVDPNLTFEFGPDIGGRRDFVLSAGGIRSSFPAVEALVAVTPSLPNWHVIAFRPRRNPVHAVEIADMKVDPKKVFVRMASNGALIDLWIYMPGYSESQHKRFGEIGYLMLDEALGEHDVETKVGGIDFLPAGASQPEHSVGMNELASGFDALFSQRTIH